MVTSKITTLAAGALRLTVWPHGVMLSAGQRWAWLSNPLHGGE